MSDKYIWVKKLGSGANAEVYLATECLTGKRYAVKCYQNGKGRDVTREGQMMQRLDHPAIPKVKEMYVEAGTYRLVMEYVPGTSLKEEIVSKQGLSWEQSVSWGIEICEILSSIHCKGILYRDLKPGNILVTPDKRLKLIDFGASIDRGEKETTSVENIGTVGFAPPEQYRTDGVLDERCDIYALGATLHYMITGVHPGQCEGRFFPIHRYGVKIPQQLARILERCLSIEVQNRFRYCAEVKEELKNVQHPQTKKRFVMLQEVCVTQKGFPLDSLEN